MGKNIKDDLRALYHEVLPAFIEFAFEIAHPKHTYVANWHVRHICQSLRDQQNGDLRNLIINLPPRTLKTFVCSVVYPLYCAVRTPGIRMMHLSGHQDLRASIREQLLALVNSPQLLALFPELSCTIVGNDIRFANGSALYQNVYGRDVIGRGFDLCVIDDPQTPHQMRTAHDRLASNSYFGDSVLTRRNLSTGAGILLTQQRLHRDDLSGHVRDANWIRVALPAIATHDMFWGNSDFRYGYARGEALFPAMLPKNDLAALLKQMGGVQFLAQFQQSPLPDENLQETSGYCYYEKDPAAWKGWGFVYGRVPQARWVWEDLFAKERTILRHHPSPMTKEDWERENGSVVID